ncbi:hypothetical protein NC652_040563 [Populus alba x Populus x berolinensis]|nr:hypothetical protein NC652_040563 [Populus alba x Populus x berolinensis]
MTVKKNGVYLVAAAPRRQQVLLSHTFPQLQWQNQQQPSLPSSSSTGFNNTVPVTTEKIFL